jgi:tetratricopeptide (TPR) repeat protein
MRLKKTQLLLVVSTVALAALIGGCMSKAKQHLYNAEDLFEKRDLKGAQAELQQAVTLDPSLLDAHKSLAHVDEYLGDTEGAAREYDAASQLDPSDQKIMNKARYYRQMKELANSADKALEEVKSGQIEEGIKTLKDILTQTKEKTAHQKAVEALQKAGPMIQQQADDLAKQGKYPDAINDYAFGIRAYLLVAQATQQPQVDPAADQLMKSINAAAKSGGTPDRPFQILNEVLTVDPDNKTAKIELAEVYMSRTPPDETNYSNAADMLEGAGAPDAEVAKLRAKAKALAKHHS